MFFLFVTLEQAKSIAEMIPRTLKNCDVLKKAVRNDRVASLSMCVAKFKFECCFCECETENVTNGKFSTHSVGRDTNQKCASRHDAGSTSHKSVMGHKCAENRNGNAATQDITESDEKLINWKDN